MKQDKKSEAKSPKTKSERLAVLAKEPSLHRDIAKNPNTPRDVLLLLATIYADEVLQNPSFELFHLEDPNFLYGDTYGALYKFSTRPQLPAWLEKAILRHPDQHIRSNLAMSTEILPRLLTGFAGDSSVQVQEYVARNPTTPIEALQKLSKGRSPWVAIAVLSNPNVTEKIVRDLASSDDTNVLSAVAAHDKASQEIIKRLSTHPHLEVRAGVAKNVNTPPNLLTALANAPEPFVRVQVVGNRNTPLEIVLRLTQTKKIEVRRAVLESTAPRETSAALLYDGDTTLREEARRKMLKGVSTIFFDVGGTLLHVDWERVCEILGLSARRAEKIAQSEKAGRFELAKRLQKGPVPGHELLSCCLSAAGLAITNQKIELLWSKHLEKNLWSIVGDNVTKTLDVLLQKFRLAVISNSEGKVKELLEETGLARYFEVIVDSGVEGVAKPDKEIFLRGCARMKVTPKQSLYVGDVFAIDVKGAQSSGMRAALFDPYGLYETKDATHFLLIRSFSELARLTPLV